MALPLIALLSACGSQHNTAPDTSGPDRAAALADAAEIAAERPELAAREAEIKRSPEKTVEITGKR